MLGDSPGTLDIVAGLRRYNNLTVWGPPTGCTRLVERKSGKAIARSSCVVIFPYSNHIVPAIVCLLTDGCCFKPENLHFLSLPAASSSPASVPPLCFLLEN